jgi:hypothetical protein
MCKEEWVVLDALNAVKENIDPTLNPTVGHATWPCAAAAA